MKSLVFLLLIGLMAACATPEKSAPVTMNMFAEDYVKLMLDIGQYDSDFIDAYYGPEEWKPTAPKAEEFPAETFEKSLHALKEKLTKVDTAGFDKVEQLRYIMMGKQIHAAATKVAQLSGKTIPFDQEALALYDANPPHFPMAHFDSLLTQLDELLPGEGELSTRYAAFSKDFIIPKDRLDTVFQTAITEARKRTALHYELPENENFELAYVTDKSWSGYNYYQGNAYSFIQINTDFPIYIERAIDLACHEGYPGHHVYNALLEKNLVVDRGWKEFTVYPLFSPQSFIAEGSANYGIRVAFPGDERLVFERDVLFPLAGIDTATAAKYFQVQELRGKLNYAGNEAARSYLDGAISREEAAKIVEKYLFYEPDRALQRTRFFDQYRSYVINYNLGQDLVADFVEAQGGTVDNPDKRWEVFEIVLSTPRTASLLE